MEGRVWIFQKLRAAGSDFNLQFGTTSCWAEARFVWDVLGAELLRFVNRYRRGKLTCQRKNKRLKM